MPRIEKLKSNSDFRRAYARGRSYTDPALVVYAVKNRAGFCRYGITTSKKIGNAVERNRARRVISEGLRTLDAQLTGSYDIVLVARTKTVRKKSTELQPIMAKAFKKLGLTA